MTTTKNTILLVDDEPELLKVYGLAIQHAGYRVLKAKSKASALAFIGIEKIDLVLSDYRMAGGTGLELFQAIIELTDYPPPFMLMTASIDFDKDEARKLNVRKVLGKPFEVSTLIKEISEIL